MGGIIGSAIIEDDSIGERLYRVYCVVVIGIWAVLMWLALLNSVIKLFPTLGVDFTIMLFQTALFAFPLLFAFIAIGYLRGCPIPLSPADISYVAASPIRSFSLVLCSMSALVAGKGHNGQGGWVEADTGNCGEGSAPQREGPGHACLSSLASRLCSLAQSCLICGNSMDCRTCFSGERSWRR